MWPEDNAVDGAFFCALLMAAIKRSSSTSSCPPSWSKQRGETKGNGYTSSSKRTSSFIVLHHINASQLCGFRHPQLAKRLEREEHEQSEGCRPQEKHGGAKNLPPKVLKIVLSLSNVMSTPFALHCFFPHIVVEQTVGLCEKPLGHDAPQSSSEMDWDCLFTTT